MLQKARQNRKKTLSVNKSHEFLLIKLFPPQSCRFSFTLLAAQFSIFNFTCNLRTFTRTRKEINEIRARNCLHKKSTKRKRKQNFVFPWLHRWMPRKNEAEKFETESFYCSIIHGDTYLGLWRQCTDKFLFTHRNNCLSSLSSNPSHNPKIRDGKRGFCHFDS